MRINHLHPRATLEISGSPWSIGRETLDRDYAVYENDRDHVGELGAKRIRLQAEWQKCEQERGHFEFCWLEAIVDDALARGVQPWLELGYGNPNYPVRRWCGIGAGPPSDEALVAWDRWVTAMIRRFRNRVYEGEI